MDQQLMSVLPPAQQQLQGIVIQLAEIEQRLHQVSAVVARLAANTFDDLVVTPEDEARVRAALVKPRSPEVVHMLARADKRATQFRHLPKEKQEVLLARSLEQAQADAIARGVALENEREAARGD